MLDFELRTKFSNYSIIETESVISDEPFRDVVPTDEVMFDKPSYNILGNIGKWSRFDLFGEVVNGKISDIHIP